MGTSQVFLTAYIYTSEAIEETAAAFASYLDTEFVRSEQGTTIRFCAKPDGPSGAIPEFLNYVLALSVEQHLNGGN